MGDPCNKDYPFLSKQQSYFRSQSSLIQINQSLELTRLPLILTRKSPGVLHTHRSGGQVFLEVINQACEPTSRI